MNDGPGQFERQSQGQPKVELHLHMEGAAPPAFIRGLAREKHVDLTGLFDDAGQYRYNGFSGFLRAYQAASSVLQTPQDFARLTTAVLEESAANGVIYTEIFLCPDFCGGGDLAAWREHLHAIREAAAQAEARDGIIMRGIATVIRHLGPEQSRRTAFAAAETAGDFLVGLGLSGDETQAHPRDFAYAFDLGREAGLRLTAHAGELCGPQSIRDALGHLRPERIGHGVRAIEDLALVDELAEAGTVLECCPGSNVALGLYPSFRKHPIAELDRRGVSVTVSTDDPPWFKTSLRREYDMLSGAFDWDEGQFRRLNGIAARAAFCDEATKAAILKRLEPADA
ncbi:MAG: adenosine deaminase [Paracoccaceae bacterium]